MRFLRRCSTLLRGVTKKIRHRPQAWNSVWGGTVRGALLVGWLAALGLGGCEDPQPPAPRERSRLSIVRERPGALRIDGIGPIRGFGRGRDCTFIHCLELVLEAMGRKVPYDELMGVSGLAFRTQFRSDRWDVGNGDPLVGDSRLEDLFQAIGMIYEVRVVRRDELDEADALKQDIKASIDRGIPVLAANIIRPEDWGIITGYRADRTWLCRAYHGGATRTDRPANGWPTAVLFLKRRLPLPPRRETHKQSIRRAVGMFNRRRSGNHALGAQAFDYWRQDLRSVSDRNYIHANVWTYISLMDARASAVRYLRGIAREFGSKGHFIRQAADLYDREVRLLHEGYPHVPSERTFPDSLPPRVLRNRQIDVLGKAKSFESLAVDALGKAL